MDAIIFGTPNEIIYRPRGEHAHSPGRGNVSMVLPLLSPSPGSPHAGVVGRRVPARVRNLCGHFCGALEAGRHGGIAVRASEPFGDHLEMHHLEGSVTAFQHYVQFKGCTGFRGVSAIARDLFLEAPDCVVHLGVFAASVGRKVHTAHGCFLENRLAHSFRSLRVCGRIFDMSTVVKLRIDRFDPEEMPLLSGNCAPRCADILISGQGAVKILLTWDRCAWTDEVEAKVLAWCDWLADIVRDRC
jgi:hypothetical protein